MAQYCDLKGLEQVVNMFELRETPFYSVFINKDKKFECISEDIEAAKEMLINNLEVPTKNGSTAIYTIRFYSKLNANGEIDKNSEIGCNTFRLNEIGQPMQAHYAQINGGGGNYQSFGIKALLEKLEKKIDDLETKLSESETIGEIEPEEPMWMKLLGHPTLQPIVTGVLTTIASKIMPMAPVTSMAGIAIDEAAALEKAIEILSKHDEYIGQHLLKLAKIAENNPAQFNMLISMLNNF